MRVEFRHGVPKECIKWLWDKVGEGNLVHAVVEPNIRAIPKETDAWFYERIAKPKIPKAFGDDPFTYMPTVTVKDDALGILFALRWS